MGNRFRQVNVSSNFGRIRDPLALSQLVTVAFWLSIILSFGFDHHRRHMSIIYPSYNTHDILMVYRSLPHSAHSIETEPPTINLSLIQLRSSRTTLFSLINIVFFRTEVPPPQGYSDIFEKIPPSLVIQNLSNIAPGSKSLLNSTFPAMSMSISMAGVLTPMVDVVTFQEDNSFPLSLGPVIFTPSAPSPPIVPPGNPGAPPPNETSCSSDPGPSSSFLSPASGDPSTSTPPPNETSFSPSVAPSTPPVTTTLMTTVTKSTPTPISTPTSTPTLTPTSTLTSNDVIVTILSPIDAPTSTASKSRLKDHRNIMMLIGIVVGIVGFLLGGVLFLFRRRKKRGSKKNKSEQHSESDRERSTPDNIMSDESSNVRHNGDLGQSRLVHNRMLITPFHIPSLLQVQPGPQAEGEEDKILSRAENFPRRLSQAVVVLNDGYIHSQIQNDGPAANSGSHQHTGPNRLLPDPPARVPQLLLVGDSESVTHAAVQVLSGMLTVPPSPSWRPNSTTVPLPDETFHADSGVRLGRETLQYDGGTSSEWSLQSKDRLPPLYTP